MSANTRIAAAVVAVMIVPTLGCAEGIISGKPRTENQRQWTGNAIAGAYAATNKSRRAAPMSRSRVSRATDLPDHVTGPDGRDLGTDPDARVRFQLRRDPSVPGGSGGGGM
jgi:hypothetical protein